MLIEIEKLKPHPKNNYFFDDMTGDKWEDFKQSVSHRLIHAVVVTQDLVIVSGHQRYRAYKELGKDKIDIEIRHYDSDNEVLLDLINSNLKERVVGNDNPVKLGRCFAELDRINGVQHGGNRKSNVQNVHLKSQKQIAEELGISQHEYIRYKSLAKLIPEIGEMVETGKVTATTASAIARKLSPEEQKKFLEGFDTGEKISTKEAERRVKEIQDLRQENIALKDAHKRLVQTNARLQAELEERPEKVVEKEVIPSDYADLKRSLDTSRKDFQHMRKAYDDMSEKWKTEKHKADSLQKTMETDEYHTKESAIMFGAGIANFLERFGGYVWLTEKLDVLDEADRKGYIKSIDALDAFVQVMKENLRRNNNE